MVQLRDDTRRVLEKNYPGSPYLAGGTRAGSKPWWQLW
jgi:outer membrane protein assembly factor BamD